MTTAATARLSLGQCATLACLLEAAAPKVGNVHRGADFDDLSFLDFAASAVAIAPAIEAAESQDIGRTVLEAIRATRTVVPTNTNLGIVLLFAPLAAVPRSQPLSTASVHAALDQLTPEDCRLVYEAIRLARPGGLGRTDEMDVREEPPECLLTAMRAAADRDLIARQYADDFRLVLDETLPLLLAGRSKGWSLTDTIVHTHLQLLAQHPDSLIVRKCGPEMAKQVSTIAGHVLEAGQPGDESYFEAASDFDFWLRADGHRRNPGTTADLVAAALFAGLRDNLIVPPFN